MVIGDWWRYRPGQAQKCIRSAGKFTAGRTGEADIEAARGRDCVRGRDGQQVTDSARAEIHDDVPRVLGGTLTGQGIIGGEARLEGIGAVMNGRNGGRAQIDEGFKADDLSAVPPLVEGTLATPAEGSISFPIFPSTPPCALAQKKCLALLRSAAGASSG